MKNINSLPFHEQQKIANRLKALRKEHGLKQNDVANLVGVTEKTYREWEVGKYNAKNNGSEYYPEIGYCNLMKLSDLYKVSIDYLVCRSDFTTPENDYISNRTGLSEKAVETLTDIQYWQKHFPGHQSGKLNTINLILSDEHESTALSSLLNILTGYFNFNINPDKNTMYTLSKHGIIPCQIHKSASGAGVSYDPSQANFSLHDLESMYYLKIWDAIKELKEKYREQIK